MKSIVKKIWRYIEGINGLLLILYVVFVFSSSVIVSEFFSKSFFTFMVIIVIVLSVIVCPKLIRFFSRITIKNHQPIINKIGISIVLKIAFFLVPLLFLLAYYIAYYPGGFSPDSVVQLTQAIKNEYNDWHPVIQTLFAFKLPLVLTGGWMGSIVLFQVICLSAVLGYSFGVMYQYTNPGYTIISMAFIIFNPQFGNIAMYPWKDMSFAIGVLLLTTYALQIFITKGIWIKSVLHMSLFVVTAVLTTMFRHNAILFTIPLVVAVLFFITKKQGLIICLSVIVLCLGIKIPLYSVIGVEKPDERQIETLGLPMTVIGGVVKYTPETLDESTREFAYKVAPPEVWEENYQYGSYNGVKWDERTNNEIIEEYGAQKVLSMMFNCFKRSKKAALISLIRLSEASYTITSPYNSITFPKVFPNDFNLKQCENNTLQNLLNAYSYFVSNSFPHVFMYLGVIHLLLIVSVLSKCKLNKLRDWKKIFFIIPVFAYNYGTTFLMTGIGDASRFFYYTFMLIPTLLVFLFRKNLEKHTHKKEKIGI